MEAQGNGSYNVYWTPVAIGYYDVKIEVDGYPLTKQVKAQFFSLLVLHPKVIEINIPKTIETFGWFVVNLNI